MRVELRISGIVALLACVVLAACSGGQPTSGGAPSAKATATTTPAAALHCKLPVTAGQTASQQAGFISFPSGSFAADASSGTSYEIATMRYRTTQSPVLYGDSSSGTYDTAAGRWLPVAWTQVLPDGSAYAYTREASPTQSRNEIHVVDVATAHDRVVFNQSAYHVIAYTPEGIYVDFHLNGTDASSGLWLLDPTSGALKAFPAGRQATWMRIAGGAAWSYSVDGNRFGSSSFARLDLATGQLATWFRVVSPTPPEPGSKSIRLVGVNGSEAVVQVYIDEHTSEVWRLTGPGQATRLSDIPLGALSPPFTVTDSHGMWLIAGDGAVYLYAGKAFDRVAVAPTNTTPGYAVAGRCS